tara:strand:+ start:9083 stop:9790 length:708 start_codon:yes stop_codon:yes gene_type:complete
VKRKKKPPLKLNIEHPIISIIASGNSVNKLTDSDIDYIYSNTYTIGFNYAPCRFKKLNQVFYIDTRVKKYLDSIKGDLEKSNTKVTTPHNRKLLDVYEKKYISRPSGGDIVFMKYNLSITTLLRMLEMEFPNKKYVIFGLDLYADGDTLKWYDNYIDADLDRLGEKPNGMEYLSSGLRRHSHPERGYENTAKELDKIIRGGIGPAKGNTFFNANLDSKYERFKKVDWKEFIETNR